MRVARQLRSGPVKIAVPLDKVADSVRQRSVGPEPGCALEIRAIRKRLKRIAGLHRQEFADRRPADGLLNQGDEFQQFDRLTVADVVNVPRCAAGRRIGRLAGPRRIGAAGRMTRRTTASVTSSI